MMSGVSLETCSAFNKLWNNKFYYKLHLVGTSTENLSSLDKSCVKIMCCSSGLIFTFLYAASRIQNASEQFVCCIHLPFVNFALHPTSQAKIKQCQFCRFRQLCLDNHSDLDACPYELFPPSDRYYQPSKC